MLKATKRRFVVYWPHNEKEFMNEQAAAARASELIAEGEQYVLVVKL